MDRQNAFGWVQIDEFQRKGCPQNSQWEYLLSHSREARLKSLFWSVAGHALDDRVNLSKTAQTAKHFNASVLSVLEVINEAFRWNMILRRDQQIYYGGFAKEISRCQLFDQAESRMNVAGNDDGTRVQLDQMDVDKGAAEDNNDVVMEDKF